MGATPPSSIHLRQSTQARGQPRRYAAMLRNNSRPAEAHTFNTPTFPATASLGGAGAKTGGSYRKSATWAIMMTARRSPARELPHTEHGSGRAGRVRIHSRLRRVCRRASTANRRLRGRAPEWRGIWRGWSATLRPAPWSNQDLWANRRRAPRTGSRCTLPGNELARPRSDPKLLMVNSFGLRPVCA